MPSNIGDCRESIAGIDGDIITDVDCHLHVLTRDERSRYIEQCNSV